MARAISDDGSCGSPSLCKPSSMSTNSSTHSLGVTHVDSSPPFPPAPSGGARGNPSAVTSPSSTIAAAKSVRSVGAGLPVSGSHRRFRYVRVTDERARFERCVPSHAHAPRAIAAAARTLQKIFGSSAHCNRAFTADVEPCSARS